MPAVKSYRYHPLAWEEVEESDAWYLARSVDASLDFLYRLDSAIEEILDAPHRWAKHLYGTRRYVMQSFPFSVVYLDDPEVVFIIAVAHSKRKPGYWKKRL